MTRETVPFGTKTCPKDGTALSDIVGLIGAKLEAPQNFLRCPKCGTEYDEGLTLKNVIRAPISLTPPVDYSNILSSLTFGSTSKEIESAQLETKRLRERVEKLESSVSEKASPADDGVRTELGAVRKELEGVDARIEKAKEAFAGLLPDAADLAYLKVAKAYATEIHNVVTKHIEDDHRRKTLDIARSASFKAWIAIGVSVVGVAAGFWKSGHP